MIGDDVAEVANGISSNNFNFGMSKKKKKTKKKEEKREILSH